MGCCCSCCSCSSCSSELARKKDRKKQNTKEEEEVETIFQSFFEREDIKEKYYFLHHTPQTLGRRLQKYWFEVYEKQLSELSESSQPSHIEKVVKLLLTICPESIKSPLSLTDDQTLETVNKILCKVRQHPYIHPIERIWHISSPGLSKQQEEQEQKQKHKIVVLQKCSERGSLKDIIYSDDLKSPWSNKYQPGSSVSPLPAHTIALYGRQILEAVTFLRKHDFPQLGHIQTGNIFVEGEEGKEVCRLGGYDNTLLGYQSSLYRKIYEQGMKDLLDIIMFGHVIFEMATCMELGSLIPEESDYEVVKDTSVREVIRFIFDGTHITIKKILQHEFFSRVHLDQDPEKIKFKVSSRKKAVLKTVSKGVPIQH